MTGAVTGPPYPHDPRFRPAQASRRRSWTPLLWLAIGILAAWVAAGLGSAQRALGEIREERARIRVLADSLRLTLSEVQRLTDLERRFARVEDQLKFAGRISELIALRNWSRRLDSEIQSNERRIKAIDRRLRSMPPELLAAPDDSVATPQ